MNREPITLRNLPKSMCDVNGNYRKGVLVGRVSKRCNAADGGHWTTSFITVDSYSSKEIEPV